MLPDWGETTFFVNDAFALDDTQRAQLRKRGVTIECTPIEAIAGDADVVANIFRERVLRRGGGAEVWGWDAAYGGGQQKQERKREGQS